MSPSTQKTDDSGRVEHSPLPAFVTLGEQGAVSLGQAGEIVSRTMTAVWQKQADFLRHEVTAAVTGYASCAAQGDPAAITAFCVDRMRLGVERAVVDAREINDLVRQGVWQMVSLYAGLWSQGAGPNGK